MEKLELQILCSDLAALHIPEGVLNASGYKCVHIFEDDFFKIVEDYKVKDRDFTRGRKKVYTNISGIEVFALTDASVEDWESYVKCSPQEE